MYLRRCILFSSFIDCLDCENYDRKYFLFTEVVCVQFVSLIARVIQIDVDAVVPGRHLDIVLGVKSAIGITSEPCFSIGEELDFGIARKFVVHIEALFFGVKVHFYTSFRIPTHTRITAHEVEGIESHIHLQYIIQEALCPQEYNQER